jgi:hypothetical protein
VNLPLPASCHQPFDAQRGFYALGINPADRDNFTVNVRGQLYRVAGLPIYGVVPIIPLLLSQDYANLLELLTSTGPRTTMRITRQLR